MDYLTKHCDDCQCRDTDPKYPTLCELLAVLGLAAAVARVVVVLW